MVGVAGVVLAGDLVLLVKRGAEPSKGLWSIPGGAVEVGERLARACAREVAEETGVRVEVGPLAAVVERFMRDPDGRVEYHYVLLDYVCTAEPTPPTAGDDADDAAWVPLERLADLGMTADTMEVILHAREMARGAAGAPLML